MMRAPEKLIWTVIGAVLIGLVVGIPLASATPVGDVVKSTTTTVDVTANALPLPPPPRAAPSVSARPSSEAPPTHSLPQPGSQADRPSVDGATGAASDSPDSAPSVGEAAGSAHDEGPAHAFQSRPDGDAGTARVRPNRAAVSSPPSIKPAEVAALQRWIASIGPAIALEVAEAGRDWVIGLIDEGLGGLSRPAVAMTGPLRSLVLAGGSSADDLSPYVRPPATATGSRPALPNALTPADGSKTVYLLAIVALLALLIFTIWRELRQAFRVRLR